MIQFDSLIHDLFGNKNKLVKNGENNSKRLTF